MAPLFLFSCVPCVRSQGSFTNRFLFAWEGFFPCIYECARRASEDSIRGKSPSADCDFTGIQAAKPVRKHSLNTNIAFQRTFFRNNQPLRLFSPAPLVSIAQARFIFVISSPFFRLFKSFSRKIMNFFVEFSFKSELMQEFRNQCSSFQRGIFRQF